MALALGDIDGDKHLDLVVGGSQSLSSHYGLFVFRGNGKAGWTELRTNLPLNELTYVWGVALADVNGDGVPDLAVTTGESPISAKKASRFHEFKCASTNTTSAFKSLIAPGMLTGSYTPAIVLNTR